MRNGLKVLAAVVIATSAACGGDDEVELYDGDEAATPAGENSATQPANDVALMTASFEAPADAPEANAVSGTISVFPADDARDAGATPDAGDTGAPADDATDAADPDMPVSSNGEETGFRVEASLTGLGQGEHAWHIHSGPCGEDAPVVVAFSSTGDMDGLTQPLNADQEGRAEGTATVPTDQLSLDRLQTGEYSVHVHAQGGVDHGPTVACADLDGGFAQ